MQRRDLEMNALEAEWNTCQLRHCHQQAVGVRKLVACITPQQMEWLHFTPHLVCNWRSYLIKSLQDGNMELRIVQRSCADQSGRL